MVTHAASCHRHLVKTITCATRRAPVAMQSARQSALMPYGKIGRIKSWTTLLAEMSLTLAPNIVAKKTTMETPDVKKLVALPCSLKSSRLRTRKTKCKVRGSERGHDSW